MTLEANGVSLAAGPRLLLQRASLTLHPGQLHAILGPNGAGKSTLLRLLAGEQQPDSGKICLSGKPLADWTPSTLAQRRAVLPQQQDLSFGFRVEEVVALGRLPCPRLPAEQERELLRQALQAADALALWGRRYTELSGGEQRRVQFARVLAQVQARLPTGEPRYLLLDEPTANLDLAHQHGTLVAARRFAAEGNGVCAILHDPNLAFAHADAVTLLNQGEVVASGAPAEVLTAARLRQVYRIDAELVSAPAWPHPWLVTRPLQ